MGDLLSVSASQHLKTKMNKLCLVFFTLLTIAACQWAGEVEESLSEEINSRLVRSAEPGLVRKMGPSKGPRKAGKSRSSKGVKKTKSKSGRRKPVRKVGSATKSKAGRRKPVRKAGKASKSKSGRKSPSKSKSGKKSPSKSKSGRRKPVRKTGTASKSKSGKRKLGSGKKGIRTMKRPQSGSRSSGRSVTDTCFDNAMRSLKMWKDIVANFEKQSKRMVKQLGTSNSKNSKNGEFESVHQKLISIGGGDKNNLSCSGSTTNAGAAQLTNLTTVLSACKTDVEAVCNTTKWTGLANETILTECGILMEAFKLEAQACLDLSVGVNATDTATACTCWEDENMTEAREALKHCKFPSEAKAVADNLKICVAKFGECRKHEDDAAISLSACGTSTSKLTAEASKLTANSDAVTEAKTAVSTLAGSRRVRRSDVTGTALSSCTEVSTVSTQMISLVLSYPSSPEILILSANIVASTTVTCTDDEMDALAALSTSFEEAVDHLAEAIHAIQEQLATLTGTTASAETIEIGGGTATARMF